MSSLIKAVKRSPSHSKKECQNTKHSKLFEDWTNTKEPLKDGVTFYVKYIGSTLLDQENGEEATSSAIKRIVVVAKAAGKRLTTASLMICPRGIRITDMDTGKVYHSLSIYRIAYCCLNNANERICAFNARSVENDAIECHSFLCSKKKIAKAIVLTINQAFQIAYEQLGGAEATEKGSENSHSSPKAIVHSAPNSSSHSPPSKLSKVSSACEISTQRNWVDFSDEEAEKENKNETVTADDFDDCFAAFAEARLKTGEKLFSTNISDDDEGSLKGCSRESSRDRSQKGHIRHISSVDELLSL